MSFLPLTGPGLYPREDSANAFCPRESPLEERSARLVAERRLPEATGVAQLAMARDSYSYLHLPMVAGIVLVAVGLRKTLAHVEDPLELVPAVALCDGVAMYLVAHVLFRLRNVRTLSCRRLVTAGALLALIPVTLALSGRSRP